MVGQPRPCQAGRYLPEYVEYTKDKEFFSRCQNPEVACMPGLRGDTPKHGYPPGTGGWLSPGEPCPTEGNYWAIGGGLFPGLLLVARE